MRGIISFDGGVFVLHFDLPVDWLGVGIEVSGRGECVMLLWIFSDASSWTECSIRFVSFPIIHSLGLPRVGLVLNWGAVAGLAIEPKGLWEFLFVPDGVGEMGKGTGSDLVIILVVVVWRIVGLPVLLGSSSHQLIVIQSSDYRALSKSKTDTSCDYIILIKNWNTPIPSPHNPLFRYLSIHYFSWI